MKVGNNTNIEMLAAKLQQNAAQQNQHSKSGTASDVVPQTRNAASGVPVTVSQSARALDAKPSASADMDIDMSKVNAIREAIANGSFKVNASVIADKLMIDTVALLGNPRV